MDWSVGDREQNQAKTVNPLTTANLQMAESIWVI